jgi:hypothetical protein
MVGAKRAEQTRAELLEMVVRSLMSGKATVLVGLAGIGKTSLFRQSLKHESVAGFPVRHAVASASAQRFSFGALAGLVSIESGTIDPVAVMSMTIAELRRTKTRTRNEGRRLERSQRRNGIGESDRELCGSGVVPTFAMAITGSVGQLSIREIEIARLQLREKRTDPFRRCWGFRSAPSNRIYKACTAKWALTIARLSDGR